MPRRKRLVDGIWIQRRLDEQDRRFELQQRLRLQPEIVPIIEVELVPVGTPCPGPVVDVALVPKQQEGEP